MGELHGPGAPRPRYRGSNEALLLYRLALVLPFTACAGSTHPMGACSRLAVVAQARLRGGRVIVELEPLGNRP
jgi:hypothetical protein